MSFCSCYPDSIVLVDASDRCVQHDVVIAGTCRLVGNRAHFLDSNQLYSLVAFESRSVQM